MVYVFEMCWCADGFLFFFIKNVNKNESKIDSM